MQVPESSSCGPEVPDPMVLTGAEVTCAANDGYVCFRGIAGRPGGDLFVIPRQSIYRGETIWLVDENSTDEPARVDVVRADENYFYISEGLIEGSRYCATAVSSLCRE